MSFQFSFFYLTILFLPNYDLHIEVQGKLVLHLSVQQGLIVARLAQVSPVHLQYSHLSSQGNELLFMHCLEVRLVEVVVDRLNTLASSLEERSLYLSAGQS